MLIVPSIISATFKMTDTVVSADVEDLEDGEIESEGEETNEVHNEEKTIETVPTIDDTLQIEKSDAQDFYYTKSGKKKKSKSNKEQKSKDKGKKNRKYSSPTEDDFAGNIEKAIRKAMNKNDGVDSHNNDDVDERRKHKKRKKKDTDGPSKKRKKQEYAEDVDESEMMCVRGASPVQRHSSQDGYPDDDRDSYASDSSQESRGQQPNRQQRHNRNQRERNKNNKNERRRGAHPMQDPDGVCLYFMQGKCHKGDDCVYSHDAQPPRKMELCKFYLMECCAKRDKCLYMHADFPCKYYHTGLPCIFKDDCKFAHGEPLSENLKNILLKHIESAPKEILGDFPRLNREGAFKMIQTTQAKLLQQYSGLQQEPQEKTIPSLFEINIPNPQNNLDLQTNQYNINDRQNKISPKVRQSRWQNDISSQNFNVNMSPSNSANTSDVLNIRNLTGVLTPKQISDLTKMGIENLDQLGQLTVLQLNSIGLSLKQITEIQLNTMNIQKLGLINSGNDSQQFISPTNTVIDLDLRVPPVPSTISVTVPTDLPGKDVDMRFQPTGILPIAENPTSNNGNQKHSQTSKDMIDIDQYTKDALKFASKDKENIDISNDSFEGEKPLPVISNESKDVDHRVLPFSDEGPRILHSTVDESRNRKDCDTDIRFLQPEPLFKNPEKRHRRSTTDDEDNNLLIDEKWYSSDEEKGNKKKTPVSSPQKSPSPQPIAPHAIEPSTVLSRLGDLSKIDISEEVTKLLNTMKNNLTENKVDNYHEASSSPKRSRDPRSRRSPDKVTGSPKTSTTNKKPSRISIYECVDGEPTDGRRRTDVDLRKSDFNVPSFGDTDLRQSSGDIDFRLGLPFKPLPNYTPASEINGSINSHPPIPYKLVLIEIPRPDYTDIRNSTAKSQALVDPRLRKVFRLSLDESNSDTEKTSKTTTTPTGPRVDPRRKPKDTIEIGNQDQKSSSLDLQTILQNSNWYKDLSSTQKIFVNQHLAPVTQLIKQYHQEKLPGKKIDITPIQSNTILCSIFANLGISLGENGEYTYLPKPKEALLKTPINFSPNQFGINSNMPGPPGSMDGGMMNMSPMGMGSMNMGNMHAYNQQMSDPRGGPTPGLLGIAPNIPHNFNANFGGPNNFGNMPFNGPGPGNDFNFMDNEQNFPRFPNRSGHRGRGNDRWNRGGSGRGNRDRKNFNDRGNWKNDRN